MAEYIEREALIYDIEAAMDNGGMGYSICQTLKRYVKRQPSADVSPVVHGKWDDSFDGITPYCSVCGRTHSCMRRTPAYCPNCGAKMDLEEV